MADRIGAHLFRECKGFAARLVANPRRQATPQGFLIAEDAPGEDQLWRHVVAHQPAQQHDAGQVGDEAPLNLHDRQLRIGRDKVHVGAEAELESAAHVG
jgi:hypothetical protein